ncbi:TetR/AcrR family transcriptional regulator [Piscinibacter sakaiensis]|uniref:TetR/AcrR family transcriptional regulator n=1 Tax=Piscinibacter sakaiensis TaxID=1547922 RepID=UPI0006B415E9|nr:TetR/AcrR family transcriptional regulator [Piscinibacter sakaiensis]
MERPSAEFDERGTRERLLLAAERLIADEGVASVSMRRINVEAGARNLSAVHYHFGSLDNIIAAVFEYRMGAIDRRRRAMLDEVLAHRGDRLGVPDVLHVVVWPLAELMLSQSGNEHYVRFSAAVNRLPRFDSWQLVKPGHRRGLVRCYLLLRRMLSSVPRDVLHTRLMMELRALIYSLADVDAMIRHRHAAVRDPLVLFHASELVTRIGAALSAPVSESTLMARHVLAGSAHLERGSTFGADAMWSLPGRGTAPR